MKKTTLVALFLVMTACLCSEAAGFSRADGLLNRARKGDAKAQVELGKRYFHGDGVLKNPGRAAYWIKTAYENKNAEAETVWNRLELWQYSVDPDDAHPAGSPEKPKHSTYVEPVTGMEFVWIEPGCVRIQKPGDPHEQKRVCVDGFWMAKYEVTRSAYAEITGRYPSRFRTDGNLPVESVSWEEAVDFARKLGTSGAGGKRFALPTRAQWMYACSGGREENRHRRNNESGRISANCGTCVPNPFRGRTAPVGSFTPNRFGLYDMAGNVAEWCRMPHGKDGKKRPAMGGSFADNADDVSCLSEKQYLSAMKSQTIGIRLVKTE